MAKKILTEENYSNKSKHNNGVRGGDIQGIRKSLDHQRCRKRKVLFAPKFTGKGTFQRKTYGTLSEGPSESRVD